VGRSDRAQNRQGRPFVSLNENVLTIFFGGILPIDATIFLKLFPKFND
jgi:hypothetical protein